LREAAQQAVLTNPEVLARFHALEAARNERDAAFGGFLPRVDVTAGAGRDRYNDPVPERRLSSHSTSVTLTQLLFDGFATANDVKRLDHASRVRLFELYDITENITLEVARAYLDVLRYRTLVAMAEENYVRHRSVFEQIQKKAAAGVGRRVDLEQAAGRLALSEANLLTDTANLHDVSARYQRLVGATPPKDMPAPATLNRDLPTSMDGALKRALERNPGLIAAIENVRSADRAARTRNAAYQPRVDLRLRSDRGNNLSGVEGDSSNTSAQVVLSWNLFNGLSDMARTRQFAEQLNVARDQRDNACRNLRQTLLIALNDTAKLTEQLTYFDQHQLSIEKARDAYRKQFDIGQRTLLDVLDTENELFSARRAYANAEYDREIAYARVQAGTGNLFSLLGLSRGPTPGLTESAPDGAEQIQACALEGPVMYTPDKQQLNERAMELMRESAAPVLPEGQPATGLPGMPAVPAATPVPVPAAVPRAGASESIGKSVANAVTAWAAAWKRQDVDAYLASYSPGFKPDSQPSRQAWEAQRRHALGRKQPIELVISQVQIDLQDGRRPVTTFVQAYRTPTYADEVRKRLEWEYASGTWLIVRESSEPFSAVSQK
jgi:adhesin transport system outer membrane protein